MLEALPLIKKDQPDADFILQKAPNVDRRELEAALDTSKIPVRIVEGHPYDTMGACDAALATSGTVVLEAALMDLPSVICYKASPISMAIAKALVKVKYAGSAQSVSRPRNPARTHSGKDDAGKYGPSCPALFDPAEGAKVHQDLREAIYKLEPGRRQADGCPYT